MSSPFLRGLLAAACVAMLSACKPAPPAERLAEAQQLLQEKQTALGIIKLEQLVTDAPDDPATLDARMILGTYFMESLKQYRRAEPFFREVYEREGLKTDRGTGAFMYLTRIPFMDKDFAGTAKLIDEANAKLDPKADAEMVDELALMKSAMQIASGDDALTTAGLEKWRSLMLDSENPNTRGRAREQLAAWHRSRGDFAGSSEVYDAYMAKYADDTTSPHLILAKAINSHLAKNEAEATELFDKGEELMSATIALELNKEKRGQATLALARYNESVGRYAMAEKLMLQTMAENTGTRLAIETQFGIGDMFLRAGEVDRAVAVYERIDRENANTNIAATARQRLDQVAEIKRALDAQKAAAGDSATSDTAAATKPE